MGEYAEYALASAMRRGIPHSSAPRALGPRVPCPVCQRATGGGVTGMRDHLKAAHAMRYREATDLALQTMWRPTNDQN